MKEMSVVPECSTGDVIQEENERGDNHSDDTSDDSSLLGFTFNQDDPAYDSSAGHDSTFQEQSGNENIDDIIHLQNNSSNDENNVDEDFYGSSGDENHDDIENNSHLDQPVLGVMLYEGSKLNIEKSVVVVMDLYVKNKLTKKTLQDLLTALQELLPSSNKMPKTNYELFKFVRKEAPVTEILHYYCRNCEYYFGLNDPKVSCQACFSEKGANKMFEFDIIKQIRHLFEVRNLADVLQVAPNCNRNFITDVTDGSEYKRVIFKDGRQKYDLTLITATDGLSLFKGSMSKCWPLVFVIAEVVEHLRESFLVTVMLWYDEKLKPIMNTFLRPVSEKLKECFHNGVTWTHPETKEMHVSKVVAPLIIADAPARAEIQNVQYFSGKFGCNICEIKTKKSRPVEGKKTCRIYAFQESEHFLRTAGRMKKQGKIAVLNKLTHVLGVKGEAIVSAWPMLDISTCVLPEYMHAILLGIVKQFFNIWFLKPGPWSVKEFITEIDECLLSIQVPYFFNRSPRSIAYNKFYKASEFLNWALYFSVPVLATLLKEKYFQHWLLFVSSLFKLLSKPISIDDLDQTEIVLKIFVRNIDDLYGDREYTYNVHQLLHMVLCVKRWGPLYATSAFPFENFNGILAKSVHGSHNIGQEIANNLVLAQGLESLRSKCGVIDNNFRQNQQRDYLVVGKPKKGTNVCAEEVHLIESIGLKFDGLSRYACVQIKNKKFTSEMYKKIKTNSYTVHIVTKNNDTFYGSIRFFFVYNNNLFLVLRHFNIEHVRIFVHSESSIVVNHIVPIKETNNFLLFKLKDLQLLSHLIRVGDFVCKRPYAMNKVM